MSNTERSAAGLWQRIGFASAPPAVPFFGNLPLRPTIAQPPANMRLFRVVTIRGDLVLGLSPLELAALGPGPDLDRLARRLATESQVSGWLYRPGRGPAGGSRLQPAGRVAVLSQDALTLEPHVPTLPVQPPSVPLTVTG